jgi:hypothetical protein
MGSQPPPEATSKVSPKRPDPPELTASDEAFAREQASQLAQGIREIVLMDYGRKGTRDFNNMRVTGGDDAARDVVGKADVRDVQTLQEKILKQVASQAPEQLAKQQVIEKRILDDPAVKRVLPELALVELQKRFNDIHPTNQREGLSKDQLRTYVNTARDLDLDSSFDIHAEGLMFALLNLDRFANLDTTSKPGRVTLQAIDEGLRQFGDKEAHIYQLKLAPDTSSALNYMNDHFDAIQGAGETGLCSASMEHYMRATLPEGDPARSMLSDVLDNFDDFSFLDPSDGDRDPARLWVFRGNAKCITHSDIAAGLKQVQANPKLIAELEKYFDTWLEK